MQWLSTFGMIIGALLVTAPVTAGSLKIEGIVRDHVTGEPVDGAVARLYKNGVKVDAELTTGRGRFMFELENNAQYIVRVGMEGHVTKCFEILTYGPQWEGRSVKCNLDVEMTLLERVGGLDLSFFDMPLGMARFEPLTGSIVWNKAYEQGIAGQWIAVMGRYDEQRSMLIAGRP